MRILETKYYTMYLNNEEFELLHRHCNSVGYGYVCEDSEWKLTLTEEMLEEIDDLLEREYWHQLNDECYRAYAEEIRDLRDSIYYELD
jgi:hypothetical protein